MTTKISSSLTAAVLSLVVILGAWMWYLQPERAVKWAIAMFMLPGAWAGVMLLKRLGAFRSATTSDADRIRRALAGAGLIVSISLIFAIGNTLGFVGGSVSERAMGVVIGAMLAVIGNAIPKNLEPLSETRCEPSRTQALQRFAGWTFVLAGLTYATVWLVAPLAYANMVAMLAVAVAVLLVVARTGWGILAR